MAFLDSLKFWRKEEPDEPLRPLGAGFEESSFGKDPFGQGRTDDLGLSRDRTAGLGGTGELGTKPLTKTFADQSGPDVSMFGQSYEKPPEPGDLRHAPLAPMERPAQYGSYGSSSAGSASKDIEIISAKLDAIKANVESMNHRLENIERILMTQERKRVQW